MQTYHPETLAQEMIATIQEIEDDIDESEREFEEKYLEI